jgi:hypothetical protein
MNIAKFPPELHLAAKKAALDHIPPLSLTQWVANAVKAALAKKK